MQHAAHGGLRQHGAAHPALAHEHDAGLAVVRAGLRGGGAEGDVHKHAADIQVLSIAWLRARRSRQPAALRLPPTSSGLWTSHTCPDVPASAATRPASARAGPTPRPSHRRPAGAPWGRSRAGSRVPCRAPRGAAPAPAGARPSTPAAMARTGTPAAQGGG